MAVKFKIYNDLKKRDEKPVWDGTYMCFANLKSYYDKLTETGGIHYFVHKTVNEEIVKWYQKKLNTIGLKSRLHVGEKYYNFYVNYQGAGKYLKTLCILCAIRYLEESPFPEMVEWVYNQCQKYPKIPFFDLFQLMHHSQNGAGFNWNHAFLQPAGNIYSGKVQKIIPLEKFLYNLDNYISTPYATGLNFVITSKKQIQGKENLQKIVNLIKSDQINECLEFMHEKKKETLAQSIDFDIQPIFLGQV